MKPVNLIPARRIIARQRQRHVRRSVVVCSTWAFVIAGVCTAGQGLVPGGAVAGEGSLAERLDRAARDVETNEQLVTSARDELAAAQATLRATRSIADQPDWSALPHGTPRGIERLLRRCLEKDRRQRLRDIGDADADLMEVPETARPRSLVPVALTAAAIAIVMAGAAAISLLRSESAPPRPLRSMVLTMLPPDDQRFLTAPVPSPPAPPLPLSLPFSPFVPPVPLSPLPPPPGPPPPFSPPP